MCFRRSEILLLNPYFKRQKRKINNFSNITNYLLKFYVKSDLENDKATATAIYYSILLKPSINAHAN